MHELSFVVGIKQFNEAVAESTEDIVWVKAAPWDSWDHPMFGTTDFPRERGERMKEHFYSDVRGHEIATDFEHGLDRAKGDKASGWIKEVDAREDGFWLGIQFTELAKKEIADGEWKYFSYQFADEWEHPHTKTKYEDVLTGGGLTNKPWIKGNPPINFSELYTEVDVEDKDKPKGEVADKEHSEPGSGGGGEPEPRKDDPAGKDHEPGTREDSPNVEPEAKVTDLDTKLREALGLDKDADIIKVVTDLNKEIEPIREATKSMSEKKSFSEQYPEEYKEMQRLREQDKKREARAFSERYSHFKDEDGKETGYGFSGLALEKLSETHKKFSEGTGTVSDFSEILDLVASGKGIVQFSETGSTISTTEDNDDDGDTSTDVATKKASKKFAEKVAEVMEKDNLDNRAAIAAAAKANPELFKAYRDEMEGVR